ncbi:MAG: DegT/DnrJ/EryC1/StrS family aminotransferase [Armatimonadota bacterium]|nr:DegT/DnrJ/EryC1/StrS family aminotransferase [Armatimonadota bacterium]
MYVPMADLRAQYQSIRSDIDKAVQTVMENGRYILGENVAALEKEIAEYCGSAYGIGVASGTDALALSLKALGVKAGDEVITTPFTFVATVEVIALLGARPIFVDIDPKTFNISPTLLEDKITPKTKVIMPVHLYGQAADMTSILEVARRHNVHVVCDGAQAIGAEHKGKPIGCYGDMVTLSFFPTKNLGAAGDGGMVLTNNQELAEKVKYLRFHGSGGTYSYKHIGYCSRLDELQASILRAKLPYLDGWNERRRNNAAIYNELFADACISIPIEQPGNKHVYHQYTIRTTQRDELRSYLKSAGIETGIYYPTPLHYEEAYRYLGYKEGDFPEAEKAAREVLSLPVFPELTEQQLAHVAATIRTFFE